MEPKRLTNRNSNIELVEDKIESVYLDLAIRRPPRPRPKRQHSNGLHFVKIAKQTIFSTDMTKMSNDAT